jgi:hypothetical protein
MKVQIRSFAYKLVTNATSYDVFIGQKALFPRGFTIDN